MRSGKGPAKAAAPRSREGAPEPAPANAAVDRGSELSVRLHTLQNTLASLRLRLSILGADPTCRWAQEENVDALQRIADQAMSQAHELRAELDGLAPKRIRGRAR